MFIRIAFLSTSLILPLTVAADETDVVSFTAITISIDDKGNGKFTVDTRPVEEAHQINEPKGQLIEIKSMEPASVYKLDDGRLHLRCDFSKIKTLDGLQATFLGEDDKKVFSELRIDSDEGLLVLAQNQFPRSNFRLPRLVSVPINIRILLAGVSEGMTQLKLYQGQDLLVLGLHGENSAEKGIGVGTVNLSLRQKDKWKGLVQKAQPPNSRDETSFQIPTDFSTERIVVELGRIGSVPLGVPMIDVVANFPASFGMKLSPKGSKILIEQVISDSAAEKAGIKAGDVLISVNGQTVKDVATSLSLLAKNDFGQVAELEIERFGKKRTIQVTPQ
jgi:hypothetical protein